jgi:hypothetical protein
MAPGRRCVTSRPVKRGYLNMHGKPYAAASINAMLEQRPTART